MAIVVLDHLPSVSYSLDTSLDRLLLDICKDLPARRMIRSIACDGIKLTGDATRDFSKHRVLDYKTIEIQTLDREIWNESGESYCQEALSKLFPTIIAASERLRECDEEQGLGLFLKCLEVLERFLEDTAILQKIKNPQRSESIQKLDKELSRVLEKILHLQESKDYVTLGECLEYELLDNLDRWKEAIPTT